MVLEDSPPAALPPASSGRVAFFLYITAVVLAALSALGLMASMAISPATAVGVIGFTVVVGWGVHRAQRDHRAWSLPGLWVGLGCCGVLMFSHIALSLLAALLGAGVGILVMTPSLVTVGYALLVVKLAMQEETPTGFPTRFKAWGALPLALMLGLALPVLNLAVISWLGKWVEVNPVLLLVEQAFQSLPLGWVFVAICLLPAIGEELLFRRYLGRGLVARYGPWAGVLLTSLLFALVHMNVLQGVSAFSLGIVAHVVYRWTGTLLAPILLHLANNSTAIVMSRMCDESRLGHAMEVRFESWLTAPTLLVALEAVAGFLCAIACLRRAGAPGRSRRIFWLALLAGLVGLATMLVLLWKGG